MATANDRVQRVLDIVQRMCEADIDATVMITFNLGGFLHAIHVGEWGRGRILFVKDNPAKPGDPTIVAIVGPDDPNRAFMADFETEREIPLSVLLARGTRAFIER